MCHQRYGANELLANHLYVNNNLFTGNLRTLVYVVTYPAKTSKSSIASSQPKKWRSSINEPATSGPCSTEPTRSGSSIPTLRPRKNSNVDANLTCLLLGKTKKSKPKYKKKMPIRNTSSTVPKNWENLSTKPVSSWVSPVPTLLATSPVDHTR